MGVGSYPSTMSSSSVGSKDISPFEQMKATLRNNLKGLKKEEDKEGGSESQPASSIAVNNPMSGSVAGSNIPTRRVRFITIINDHCRFKISFLPSAMAKTSGKLTSYITFSEF